MTNPNEESVESHVRFWSRVYNRLRDVKSGTSKSLNWVINVLLDVRFKELAEKMRFVDKEQGEEIRKIILQLANDVQAVRRDLDGACRNFNQVARNSNIAMKQPPVVIKKTEFKITPDMHKDYIDHAGELRVWKDRLQRDIADGKSADVINETKRRLFAVEHHIKEEYVPLEAVADVIEKAPPLELSDDELRSAFIDVDKAQAVNVQILSSMEQLSALLTRMV